MKDPLADPLNSFNRKEKLIHWHVYAHIDCTYGKMQITLDVIAPNRARAANLAKEVIHKTDNIHHIRILDMSLTAKPEDIQDEFKFKILNMVEDFNEVKE